jgi:phosphoribosyl 1,2-cyclic phosphodiesterase
MLQVTVLGSGSRGNAILVDGSEGSVLIDAGFGTRPLAKRLLLAKRHADEIHALLLTHEHIDHASGAHAACTKWGWPAYASPGTMDALRGSAHGCPPVMHAFREVGATDVAGFAVATCAVPHDARDCRALVLTDRRSGARVGIAMDLGRVPPQLPTAFERLDLLVVESNHDEAMLAEGPYPRALKQRISGGFGHLSNGAAAAFIGGCAHRGLRGVILTHLSETNNAPELAVQRTRDALREAGWTRDALRVASQRVPVPPVMWRGAAEYAPVATQLGLGL